jgi:ubiquinol-cytochrome c reductase cytochrome c1 subunit
MVRILGILVGLGMVAALAWSFGWGVVAQITDPPAHDIVHEFHREPKPYSIGHNDPFGVTFDKQQLQRGFQVYKEVCSACHSLSLVAFRDLEGLGYEEAEVKAIAKQWAIEVPDVNPDTGEPSTRKAIAADHFPAPYANEVAARAANNNALPPDLSLMAKAREGGAAYIHSLLTGYQNPPANLPAENRPAQGLHYNPYFANLNIAMPQPLTAEGQVTYADGTKATVDQMAQDVSAFLSWTAEPKMEARKKTGLYTMAFLAFLLVLSYMAYRNVWADEKHRRVRRTGPLDAANQAKSDAAKRDAGVQG